MTPLPPTPPHPVKISLITKSGSIIHYVQQHYTRNIQKLLLIGRMLVVTSEKNKKHTRKQRVHPELVLVWGFVFSLFYTETSVNFWLPLRLRAALRCERRKTMREKSLVSWRDPECSAWKSSNVSHPQARVSKMRWMSTDVVVRWVQGVS